MGPIRTPGGPPNPRGRVPHQRRSRALVTPPPPVGPCSPAFFPRGPGPLLCPLAPALSRLPLLAVSAPACWCPWLLALCLCFFFFFFFFRPRPFCGLASVLEAGGGGVLAVLPFAQGGGGVAVWPPSSPYPSCGCTPGGPPVGACTARAPLGHGRLAPLSLHPAAVSPGGGPPLATVIPLVPSPSPRCPRLCPRWVREVGARGGGVRPRCPSSGVSTSQARHWHAARPLSSCWGVRHAAWPLPLPCPRCVLSPGAPPAGEGGPLPALPFPQPPPLGGRRLVGGGGLVVFLPLPSRRRHEAWLSSLCRGGGVSLAAPSVAPSILRPHPRWSPRRGSHGARPLRARSCGSSRTLLPLPPHPDASSGGGGGGLFSPPPFPHSPSGGWWWWGGVGRPLRPPSVARTSQACRRHSTTTGALGCRGGGGEVSLWAFPPCSMVKAPHSMITSRCCPLGGSRRVSAWCSVSRACSLLCPYLLEEVRTRVDSEDDEVRAAGRTYRTPRRLLAPSAALDEGWAPVSAPNSPGGADLPSSPWCLCIHFRAS